MSIDASIYVAAGDTIIKYTRGVEEAFETDYPDKTVKLAGIYTDEEIEQVYAWDRDSSVIYVLEKDGGYIRQLHTSILKKAASIFVKEAVYILAGNKIYVVSLD